MVRRIHSILLLLALLIGAAGMNYVRAAVYSGTCGAAGNEANVTWSWNEINRQLTISGTGKMADYTSSSPAPWDSYKTSILAISIANTITSIGDYAFAQCRPIITLSIGTGVTSIGSYAFSGCTLLTSARLPNGVTTIGNAAFYNCSNLRYVSIPSSVTSLGSQAFYGCTNMKSITIPNSVTKLGTYTLSGSGIVDIYVYWTTTSGDHCIPVWTTGFVTKVPQTAVTLHVPCGTRSMYMGLTGWWDFTVVEPQYTITAQTNNSSYGTVKIDDGTAGENVSKPVNCATNVTLTAVTTTSECNIDFLQWNDGNKDNPRTITAERSITYTAQFGNIGGDCGANGNNLTWSFNRCTGVLTISGSGAMVHYWAYEDIPWWNYRGSIQRIVIEEGVTTIGNHAFVQCSNLTSVSLPNTLTAISYLAFGHCIGLPSLTIPSSVTSMADMFIHNTQSLTDVYVSWTGDDVPTMPADIHQFDASHKRLHMPCGQAVNYIAKGWNTKFTIDGVVSGTCGDNVQWTFESCNSTLTISGTGAMKDYWISLDKVPWYSYREAVKSVIVTSGVTNIGDCAFDGCSSLTSVTLPSGLVTIGKDAFSYCSELSSIIIPDNVTSIGNHAFYRCSKMSSVTFPNGLISIGQFAFGENDSLSSVTIPRSVTDVGWRAFGYWDNEYHPNDITVEWTENIPWCLEVTNSYPQSDITLHVPCEAIELYKAADGWKDYTIEGEGGPYTVTVQAEDPTMGNVSITVNP